jgi:hypothetical protein
MESHKGAAPAAAAPIPARKAPGPNRAARRRLDKVFRCVKAGTRIPGGVTKALGPQVVRRTAERLGVRITPLGDPVALAKPLEADAR